MGEKEGSASRAIPVTRVSNGKGGWADLILTKDSRPPPLSHQCTAELSSLVKLIPAVTAMARGASVSDKIKSLCLHPRSHSFTVSDIAD